MPTSSKKVASNRINGLKSHGPKNTNLTRYNALRHGLRAVGITELDDPEDYRHILSELMREKAPVGVVEEGLVNTIALEMVKLIRVGRLESEYVAGVLHPPQYEKDVFRDLEAEARGAVVDPGTPATFGAGSVLYLVTHYQRYNSGISNSLYRALHELERLQRMRQGERLPAPAALDVGVHTDIEKSALTPAAQEQSKVLPDDDESLPAPDATEVGVQSQSGMTDTTAAAPEQSNPLPSDGENLPAAVTVDKNLADNSAANSNPAELEQREVLPDDGKNPAPLPAADVENRATGKLDSAPAWSPRVRSGPIWSKR
jgi:hypothetical protein